MSKIINLPSLISAISASSGIDPATVRRFVHQLFALVEDKLLQNESVNIDGIGEFTKGFSKDNPILFRPDKKLAELINEPFAAFTPIEVNEGAEAEMENININNDEQPTSETEGQNTEESDISEIHTEDNEVTAPVVRETPKDGPVMEKPDIEEPDNQYEPIVNPVSEKIEIGDEDIEPTPFNRPNTTLWLLLGILIGIIIGIVCGYFAGKTAAKIDELTNLAGWNIEAEESEENESSTSDEPVIESNSIVEDTIKQLTSDVKSTEPVNKAEPEEVYDTVTKTLSALAGKHYGNRNYWVFIFKANPNLKDPDKIAPGTRVLVPPYDSFAEETREATDAKAKRLIAELNK